MNSLSIFYQYSQITIFIVVNMKIANLLQINIDSIVKAILSIFSLFSDKTPQFKVHGGSPVENMALQNIQVNL